MSKKIFLSLFTIAFVVVFSGATSVVGAQIDASIRAEGKVRLENSSEASPILYGEDNEDGEDGEMGERVRMENRVMTEAEVEVMKQERETRREEFKTNVSEKREELKQERETNREELKTRLEAFKDEARAMRVGRLADNFGNVNERITTVAVNQLDKLSEFLVRIQARATVAFQAGKDVTAVEVAISSAETSIADARAIVLAQAGNVYEVDFEDEATVKEGLELLKDQIKGDLKAVREAVMLAKGEVRDALQALVQVVDAEVEFEAETSVDVDDGEETVDDPDESEVE